MMKPAASEGHPGVNNCTARYFTQQIDHYAFDQSALPDPNQPRWQQRYFVCDQYWNKQADGPVFFYTGNEANVELYVNHTGLMWENAQQFGALLIFAEHRYFGSSQPFGAATKQHMQWLSVDQAIADFAAMIYYLKQDLGANNSAVVAFGGSYGGMLASWLRIKFPNVVDGVIAGSAPILSFMGETPAYFSGSFAEVVTYDASTAGGSTDACKDNIKAAWADIFKIGGSKDGRTQLASTFKLCDSASQLLINSEAEVYSLAGWLQSAMDYMAMGSYPFASSYILNGGGTLPPYPLREMCKPLSDPALGKAGGLPLLAALKEGIGVFYNYSGATPRKTGCYNFIAGMYLFLSSLDMSSIQMYLFLSSLYCRHVPLPILPSYPPFLSSLPALRFLRFLPFPSLPFPPFPSLPFLPFPSLHPPPSSPALLQVRTTRLSRTPSSGTTCTARPWCSPSRGGTQATCSGTSHST
jgi:pimeloyl-ACP methyl ester carboxylesterase